MKNNELLKKYAGISTLDPKSQAQFMDLVVEYMEETMNWPEPDNQETFEKQLLG